MEIIGEGKLKEVQYDLFTGSKARSERDMWLDEFVSKINTADRIKAGFKPITPGQILGIVKRKFGWANTSTLRQLHDSCETFDNFGKGFFHLTKR